MQKQEGRPITGATLKLACVDQGSGGVRHGKWAAREAARPHAHVRRHAYRPPMRHAIITSPRRRAITPA
jgi:hypothetical protein